MHQPECSGSKSFSASPISDYVDYWSAAKLGEGRKEASWVRGKRKYAGGNHLAGGS
jgi:hypothetical protein